MSSLPRSAGASRRGPRFPTLERWSYRRRRRAAENVAKWGQEVMQLSEKVLSASTADQAAPSIQQIQELTQHIVKGTDANGDGRVSWQAGEGGVAQAKQHMDLMARGEVS